MEVVIQAAFFGAGGFDEFEEFDFDEVDFFWLRVDVGDDGEF